MIKATLCDLPPSSGEKVYDHPVNIRHSLILVSVPLNSDFVLTPTVANVVQD